jgi:hypothetical protein
MSWWRRGLLIVHCLVILIPWFVVWWFREPWIILLCLGISVLVMTQWLVLGECVLHRFENEDGDRESAVLRWMSERIDMPLDKIKHSFVLTNMVSPMMAQIARLCHVLGV